ncbi:MAG: SpoIIE family protein phosphatase [Candidatus Riflebacteria bacterium]|nr:SpoIIE family protein phosphatase [Candidatus Riflebacteria bacterium]
MLICFALIPALLLNEILSETLNIRHQNEVEEVFEKMDKKLNLMGKYSDNAHYFHLLLKNIFDKTTKSQNKFDTLESEINKFKQLLPNEIRIITWDKNGQIVEKLTDFKKYRYFIAKLHTYLKTIVELFKKDGINSNSALEFIEKDIKTFRPLIGKFIQTKDFRLPFMPEEHGKCIIADSKNDFQLVWFNSDDNLTLLCFIKPIESQNPGIDKIITRLNRSDDKMKTGIIDINNLKKLAENNPNNETKDLLLELTKYENSAFSHRITDNRIIAFKLLTPSLRSYCIMNKEHMQTGYPTQIKNEILTKIAAALLLLIFLHYCYKLVNNQNYFSIKKQIAILFVYANGLPLLILGTIGYEHIQQYEKAIIRETHKNNERILRDLDSGLVHHKRKFTKKVFDEFDELFKNTKNRLPNESDKSELKRLLTHLNAEEINAYDKTGKSIVACKANDKIISPHEPMRLFSLSTLKLANLDENSTEQLINEDSVSNFNNTPIWKKAMNFDRFNSSILQHATKLIGKLDEFNLGSEISLCMVHILGNKETRKFNSVLFILWSMEDFQKLYIQNIINEKNAQTNETKYMAMGINEKTLIGYKGNDSEKIISALSKSLDSQITHENNVLINNEKHIFTALPGSYNNQMILCATLPAKIIDTKINNLKFKIGLLALLNFAIISAVIIALNKQFISPVHQLSNAVKQINSQNYEFKTKIENNDEFGELGKVFKETSEGLSELAVGKIVQQALLPESRHKHNNIEIFGKSVTMTKLGGDYFDHFSISDSFTGVLMGDVAGHGIPAAIIMAVAKATIILNKSKAKNPAEMLLSLHNTLYTLRKSNLKRMLTCQFITINDITGECTISNSGHCYPVIVEDKGKNAYFKEIIGTPLGITKKLKCNNHNFVLKPKDTLILYSDCLIEAINSQNEAFGSKRLLKCLEDSWNEDLETYYRNIFNANRAWSKGVDDDTTILLIRFDNEEQNNV